MARSDRYSGDGAHGVAPGVYIPEWAPLAEAANATGVPLFIGFLLTRSPATETDGQREPRPVRLARWEQYEESIGPAAPGSFLGYAVRGFFENGGKRCVVLPLAVSEQRWNEATLTGALRNLFHKDVYRNDHDGLRGVLDDIDDVDLVCVPDIMIEAIRRSEQAVFDLQQAVLDYCHDMGERLAILDVMPGDSASTAGRVEKSIRHWQALVSAEGALYCPWVRVKSLNGSGDAWVPPCGHVAGIYARSDARVGVHKAPANEIVDGVVDLEDDLTEAAQGRLNDAGVNCLRSFARRGIRVWGARTLSGHRHLQYVNVRRIFLTLVHWIKHNMNDVVFEPNNPLLWDRVLDRVRGFCYELFERGALKGSTPEEGFFVKCDAEINPLEVREQGNVVCEVGLAPLSPAEFIVIRITQSVAGTTTVAPIGVGGAL